MGVADEDLPVGQHQHVHRGEIVDAGPGADHLLDVAQMLVKGAGRSAKHGVGVAPAQQDCADQRGARAHLLASDGHGDALALGEVVIFLHDMPVALIAVDVHRLAVLADLQA
jgi:hypothetical protein